MDEHNVHHFWGISPAIDLTELQDKQKHRDTSQDTPSASPLNILQIASYDARHTVTTLCQLSRHNLSAQASPLHLYIYEEEPELLVRHLLLLSILFDGNLLAKERVETLLEVHGNTLVREQTAKYLEQQGKALENMLVSLSSGSSQSTSLASMLAKVNVKPGNAPATAPKDAETCTKLDKAVSGSAQAEVYNGINLLSDLLDISMLKFLDRDKLVEVLQKYKMTVQYDMVKAWDARQRKWFGDRYDSKKNMVDWDYHMVLSAAGTPGQPEDKGSIIHFHHYRHWRMHGVAYELRDAWYNHANRSLLSTAYGRTKEFKDRYGKDVGRSVSAFGYWGDILNGPYHCWGTKTDEDAFYKHANKQWTRTAVDIAEHNVQSLLNELRTGQRSASGEAHKARVARGPTTLADLQEEAARSTAAAEKASSLSIKQPTSSEQSKEQSENSENSCNPALPTTSSTNRSADVDESEPLESGTEAAKTKTSSSDGGQGASDGSFIPCVTFKGPKPGYAFKRGERGVGYYKEISISEGSAPFERDSTLPTTSSDRGNQETASTATGSHTSDDSKATTAATTISTTQQEQANDGTAEKSSDTAGSSSNEEELRKAADALRAAEAHLDMQAAKRLKAAKVKVIPILGGGTGSSDLAKILTGRLKYQNFFHVVSLGHRHIHLLNPEHKLVDATAPGALIAVETAKYLLQLNKDQAAAFATKVTEMATAGGWAAAPAGAEQVLRAAPEGRSAGMVLTDAHLLFAKPAAQ